MSILLQVLCALFGFLAAFFWLKSAIIKIPNAAVQYVIPESNFGVPTNHNMQNALKKQSKLSAIAAIFAGVSAICQSIALILPYFKQ